MNGEKRFGAFEREMLDNYDCPLASVRTFNVIFVCFVLYFDSSLSVFFPPTRRSHTAFRYFCCVYCNLTLFCPALYISCFAMIAINVRSLLPMVSNKLR